jgi:hypothetical protein
MFRLAGGDVEAHDGEPTESVKHRRGRCVREANLRIAALGLNLVFVLAAPHRIFRAPSGLLLAGLRFIGFGDMLLVFAELAGELQGFEPPSAEPCGGDDVICESSFGVLPFALGLIGIGVAVTLADFAHRRVRARRRT